MAGTKKHEASPRKLLKAREQGQVAQTRSLIHALALIAAAEATVASVQWWWPSLVRVLGAVLDRAVEAPELGYLAAGDGVTSGLLLSGALLAASGVTAVCAGLLLNGFLVAPKVLAPNFSRLDPVATATNMFGARGWSIFALGLAKLAVFLLVVVLQIRHSLPTLAASWRADEFAIGHQLSDVMLPIVRAGEAVLLVTALIEYAIERYHHLRSQRMDDAEMIRDHRESNGDPRQKAFRRALAHELLADDAPPAAQQPDVVLANPTHRAVALGYRRGVDAAPMILAKRRDEDARRYLDRMLEQGVTVIRSPAFTRALFDAATVGRPVPADFYQPVAVLYRLLEELDGARCGTVIDVPASFLGSETGGHRRDGALRRPSDAGTQA